jgi:hypothetical protein
MEGVLLRVMRTAAAVKVAALSDDVQGNAEEALYGLAETLDDIFREAEAMRSQIVHKTWGYAHGRKSEVGQ